MNLEKFNNKLNYIESYKQAENASIGSKFDPNANMAMKNIATLEGDIYKEEAIGINRATMYKYLSKMYGKGIADIYLHQLENHEIYRNDETGIIGKPYCTSMTMYPFLLNGLKDLGGTSEAPKNLRSFTGGFVNLVFAVAAQFCGACLHHEQKLHFKTEDKPVVRETVKELFEKFSKTAPIGSFKADGQVWEFVNTTPLNLYVEDDGGFTSVKKIYRRKYKKDICEISYWLKNEYITVKVSEDHKFKFPDCSFVPAKAIHIGDPLFTARKDNKEEETACIVDDIVVSKNDHPYVYEIETETHTYSCGGVVTHNCSTPEFLPYMDYFIRKEYGDTYYLDEDRVVELGEVPRTIKEVIEAYFQQVVYTLNQPAAARNSQCVFWNIAYFDKPYFHGMFENFRFPDGSPMQWESVNYLQKLFMKWFNKERTRQLLTFPVETVNLLDNGKDYVDQEWKNFAAEMWADGHSFFLYRSDSVDSLASCCFSGETSIIAKTKDFTRLTTFEDLWETNYDKESLETLQNGKWEKAELVRLPARELYKVITKHGQIMFCTDNHRHITDEGVKTTSELRVGHRIALNSGLKLNETLAGDISIGGNLLGAFLACGGIGSKVKKGSLYEVVFNFKQDIPHSVVKDLSQYDYSIGGKNITVKDSWLAKQLIYWTHSDKSKPYFNKGLDMMVLNADAEFRNAILEGYALTRGSYTDDILNLYSDKKYLLSQLQAVAVSLGYETEIIPRKYKSIMQYSLEIKRGKYSELNKFSPVLKIEKYDSSDEYVYCFNMKNDVDEFTLPNGVRTKNCRLRNEMQDNEFSYTLGAGGVATGSKCVMTINVNRLVQNAKKEGIPLKEAVERQVKLVHRYLLAVEAIIQDMCKAKMLPVYDAGFIALKKQYLTIGLNGLIEGAEFLGIEISPFNQEYKDYVRTITETIYTLNKQARTKDIMFNTELIPKIVGM